MYIPVPVLLFGGLCALVAALGYLRLINIIRLDRARIQEQEGTIARMSEVLASTEFAHKRWLVDLAGDAKDDVAAEEKASQTKHPASLRRC